MSDEAARAAHAAAAQWARDHNLPGFMAEWDRLDPDERDYFSVVGGAVLAADPDRAALPPSVVRVLAAAERCVRYGTGLAGYPEHEPQASAAWHNLAGAVHAMRRDPALLDATRKEQPHAE